MSNDKYEATYSGGTDWYREVARLGEAPPVPVIPGKQDGGTGERPWVSPGPPPWEQAEQEKPWPPRWFVWAVVVTFVVTGLIGIGSAVQKADLLPHWVPLIGKDSGVAACESIANGGGIPGHGKTQGEQITAAEYQKVRAVFADSRYWAIRDNGVKLMDIAWQLQELAKSDQNALAALPLVQPMTDAYTGLVGGCAEQGYVIPALGA